MRSRFDGERLDTPMDDCASIIKTNPNDVKQCPRCFQLFTKDHKCIECDYFNRRWTCSICRISLQKKPRTIRMPNGRTYTSSASKKHFNIINSVICYNCAIRIAKELKEDTKAKGL